MPGLCQQTTKRLHLQLSLDGDEARHDDIRKIPDGFQKVLDTCARVERLRREQVNFSFVVAITVMKQNLDEFGPLVDLLEEKGIPSKLSIVRGNSFSTFGVPAEILDADVEPNTEVMIDVPTTEAALQRIGTKHPTYFDAFQHRKLKIMLDTLKTRQREFSCRAGYEDAVVYNDGSVAICEQVRPFGNLADWNWDFLSAWNSRQAMEHRLKLTACACIHGCNITTAIGMQTRQKSWFSPE